MNHSDPVFATVFFAMRNGMEGCPRIVGDASQKTGSAGFAVGFGFSPKVRHFNGEASRRRLQMNMESLASNRK